MDIAKALHETASQQGWGQATVIDVLMEYIHNQRSDAAFIDFLKQQIQYGEQQDAVSWNNTNDQSTNNCG